MLGNLFKQITKDTKSVPSYKMAHLYSKATRLYKDTLTDLLKDSKISFVDWALLGLLLDEGELRYGMLAQLLGVEPSFVSVLVDHLEGAGLIKEKQSKTDKRVKYIALTKKGISFITETESRISSALSDLLKLCPSESLEKSIEILQTTKHGFSVSGKSDNDSQS